MAATDQPSPIGHCVREPTPGGSKKGRSTSDVEVCASDCSNSVSDKPRTKTHTLIACQQNRDASLRRQPTENPAYGYVAAKGARRLAARATSSDMLLSTCCFDSSCPALSGRRTADPSLHSQILLVPPKVRPGKCKCNKNCGNSFQTLPVAFRQMSRQTGLVSRTPVTKSAFTPVTSSAFTLPRLFKPCPGSAASNPQHEETSLKQCSSASSLSCISQRSCGATSHTPSHQRLSKCDMIKNKARGVRPLRARRAASADSSRSNKCALNATSDATSAAKFTTLTLTAPASSDEDHNLWSRSVTDLSGAVAQLERAAPNAPLELPFVVMRSARLCLHEEPANERPTLPPGPLLSMGTLVTALFARTFADKQQLFVRTAHGAEGFLPAPACEPLSALPVAPSKSTRESPASGGYGTQLRSKRGTSSRPRTSCATSGTRRSVPVNEENKRITTSSACSTPSGLFSAVSRQARKRPEGSSVHCSPADEGEDDVVDITAVTRDEKDEAPRQTPVPAARPALGPRLTGSSCENLISTPALGYLDANRNYVQRAQGLALGVRAANGHTPLAATLKCISQGDKAGRSSLIVVRSPCPLSSNESSPSMDILDVVKGDILVCATEQLLGEDEYLRVKHRVSGKEGFIPRKWATKVAIL